MFFTFQSQQYYAEYIKKVCRLKEFESVPLNKFEKKSNDRSNDACRNILSNITCAYVSKMLGIILKALASGYGVNNIYKID